MPDNAHQLDPAVEHAQGLLHDGQRKEAIAVLVRRIKELNATIDRLQSNSTPARSPVTHAQPVAPSRPMQVEFATPRWVKTCGWIVVFFLVAGLVLLAIGVAVFELFGDDAIARVHLSTYCSLEDGLHCDEWEDMVNDRHREAIEDCKGGDLSGVDETYRFGRCLMERGVPSPRTWAP